MTREYEEYEEGELVVTVDTWDDGIFHTINVWRTSTGGRRVEIVRSFYDPYDDESFPTLLSWLVQNVPAHLVLDIVEPKSG